MKLENHDTAVERAHIPKFSRLDDIVAPLRLLELFFDDVLVDMIVGYTKLYSHREKVDISFEITNKLLTYPLTTPNNLIDKTNFRSSFP